VIVSTSPFLLFCQDHKTQHQDIIIKGSSSRHHHQEINIKTSSRHHHQQDINIKTSSSRHHHQGVWSFLGL